MIQDYSGIVVIYFLWAINYDIILQKLTVSEGCIPKTHDAIVSFIQIFSSHTHTHAEDRQSEV